jgi:NADH:ubiquinone oxidoreductase subunit 6 (subunit J)
MSIRLRLASGTGILFNYWPLPSEMLGLINIWTGEVGKSRDPLILFLGILFSAAIVATIVRGLPSKNLWDRSVSLLGLSILMVCGLIALWAGQTSVGSNYSYVKVATYVTPIFLLIIGERMSENLHRSRAKNAKNDTPFAIRMITPVFFVGIMLLSVVNANPSLSKKSEFSFPASMIQILNNDEAQSELEKYNYLTTYRALSNVLGFVGDVHWVSKAPNDQRLESRMNNEMRIICFAGDAACAPKTQELAVPSLNKFGFRVFESPISTEQFAALAPKERYFASMDAVGQARFEIPERFIGGNPLLKPNT